MELNREGQIALVDHRAGDPGDGTQLSGPLDAVCGCPDAQGGILHEHRGLLLGRPRIPGELHGDADRGRQRTRCARHAAGLFHLRGRLGAGQHGACPGNRDLESCGLPRPARRDRGCRHPGGCQGGVRMVPAPRTPAGHQHVPDGHKCRQYDRAAAGGVLHPVVGLAIGLRGNGRAQPGLGGAMVVGLSHPRRAQRPERGRARPYRQRSQRGPGRQAGNPKASPQVTQLLGHRHSSLPCRTGLANVQLLHPALSGGGVAARPQEHRAVGLAAIPGGGLRQSGGRAAAHMADEAGRRPASQPQDHDDHRRAVHGRPGLHWPCRITRPRHCIVLRRRLCTPDAQRRAADALHRRV